MGKINGCLKCLFIFFNVLFAIVGCLLVYVAVQTSSYSHQMTVVGGPSLVWSWVFAIGVLCISCLGIYAACSEKDLALKIFAGFMGVGMVIMLIFGIIVAVAKNQIKSNFENLASEMAKTLMAEQETRAVIDGLQQSAQCCGVVSASDWGNEIPQSCACSEINSGGFGRSSGCINKAKGTRGPERVFSQNCSSVILIMVDFIFQVAMGILFSFAVTALLGLLVSLLMIYQVRRHDGAGGSSIAMKGY